MVLRITAISTAILCLAGCAAPLEPMAPTSYTDAALAAGQWLAVSARSTPAGVSWPADPAQPDSVGSDLYHGMAGGVIFLLDLGSATGRNDFRDLGLAGAAQLASALPSPGEDAASGLYSGLGGICVALHRAAQAAPDSEFAAAARRCMDAIAGRAIPTGAGVAWSSVTDIIAGSAGIGLTLLWAADALAEPGYVALARQAGERLLEVGIAQTGGTKWAMSPGFDRLMPNFSHGTAGIAYFLARLYRATGDEAFLAGALAGGRYLQAIADTSGDACLVFHHEPEGEDLYYLSWCHGPAGTARTFYELYRVTGDPQWLDWTRRSARGLLDSGLPEARTPGYWNNASRCCGGAGVADFFLDLHGAGIGETAFEFARSLGDDLVARATSDPQGGLHWVQAEHRVQPDNLAAQTGYMQGAAGIGTVLLRLDAAIRNLPPPTFLPDTPFEH